MEPPGGHRSPRRDPPPPLSNPVRAAADPLKTSAERLRLHDFIVIGSTRPGPTFKPTWTHLKTDDLPARRADLATKIDDTLVNWSSSLAKSYFDAYGVSYLISFDRAELTILNMLGNLVEAYEREMHEPFPKDNTIFALINFLSSKSNDSAITDLFVKFQEIDLSQMNSAEKDAEKGRLYGKLATFMLVTAFPKGREDLGFGYMNWPLWKLLEWCAPRLLKKHVPPLIAPILATQAKAKGVEAVMQATHDPEILELAKTLNARGKSFIAAQITEQSKGMLAGAKTEMERKLYQAAVALGQGKGAHFKEMQNKIADHLYPVILHFFEVLLKDKPEGIKPVTHILSKLLTLRAEEAALSEKYGELMKGLTPADIQEALRLMQVPYDHANPPEDTQVQRLALFLASRSFHIAFSLGIAPRSLQSMIPLWGESVGNTVSLMLATALVEFFTGVHSRYDSERPIVGYASARSAIQLIFDETVLPAIEARLKSREDEIAENPGLSETPIDPEKEKSRFGTLLAGAVNEGLAEQEKIAVSAFIESFSQLLRQPSYLQLRDALREFVPDYLTALIANLALTNPYNKPGQDAIVFWKPALEHLIHLLKTEIKDPLLAERKILHWKHLPSDTLQEQQAKEAYKQKELLPLFQPAAKKLLDTLKINEDPYFPMPKIVKNYLLDFLGAQILPDLLFDFAQGLALQSTLTPEERARFDHYTHIDRLDRLGSDIAMKAMESIKPALQANASAIAHSINEALANNRLDIRQELQLGEGIQAIIPDIPEPLLGNFLQRLIPHMLRKLAASYQGIYRGDAATAALLQIRVRFAEANLDPKIYRKIQDYRKKNKRLIETEEQLAALRAQILNPQATEDPALLHKRLQTLQVLHLELLGTPQEQKLRNKELNALYLVFRPLAIALLKDLGIHSAKDLPLAEVAQAGTYAALVDNVLPDQLMRLYSDYLRFGENAKTHKRELDLRFPSATGKKHGPVVNALTAIAAMATHFADNYFVANAEEIATQLQESVKPPGRPSIARPSPVPGQTVELNGRLLGGGAPTSREFLYPMVRKEIKGALFDIVNNLSLSLERVGDHAAFGPFVLDAVRVLTQHLHALNSISKGRFIHEVPPSAIAAELEANGQAHPAFPSSQALEMIEKNEKRMRELDATQGAQREIDNLKKINAGLRVEFKNKLEKKFYKDMTLWILKMAGKHSAKDLAVSPAFQEQVWELLQTQIGPAALREMFEGLGSAENLNKLLTRIVTELSKTLKTMTETPGIAKPAVKPVRAYAEYPGANEAFKELLKEMGTLVPGTWTEWLLKWKPVRKILGGIIENNLREFLVDWSIRSITELALTEPDENAPLYSLM